MKQSRGPDHDAASKSSLAVGYVRIASFSQLDLRSRLDAQIALIRATGEAAGIELNQVFEDYGESAHNLQRPGLLALLEAVDSDRVDVIIVPDLSRLARDEGGLRFLLNAFEAHGVRLVFASEPPGGGA